MEIAITPKQKRLIDQKIKKGDYKNTAEVIGAALNLLDEKDRAFTELGSLANSDLEALVFIVMMEAAKSAAEDLKEIMKEIQAKNAAKQKLREFLKKVKCDIANNSGKVRLEFGQNGMGSERAYHHVLIPVEDPCSESSAKLIETDLHKGRIADISILESIRDDLRDKLDSLSEMGEMESLRLQMIMDRRSKMIQTLSNIMKKMSDTSQSIIQNMK
jgi:Arc/MetJ-type ribon-helix-helix transcriptional regulator